MSEAQQNASRKNGQKSHGATSPEGKAICSQNAVKHGLCARKILCTQMTSKHTKNAPKPSSNTTILSRIWKSSSFRKSQILLGNYKE